MVNQINDPPILSGIPDISFLEDSSATIHLNEYVFDMDDSISHLSFESSVISYISYDQMSSHKKKFGENETRLIVDLNDLFITIDSTSHVAYLTSTSDSSGVYSVVFRVKDEGGLSDTDTIQVSIMPVNDVPKIFSLPEISFNEDDSLYHPLENWYPYIEDNEDVDSLLTFELYHSDFVFGTIKDHDCVFRVLPDSFGVDTLTLKIIDTEGFYNSTNFTEHTSY
jgi:hypothetical protein